MELGVDRGEDLLKLLSEVIKERWDIDIMKYYNDAKKSVNDALDRQRILRIKISDG